MSMIYEIIADEAYEAPEGPIATNEEYLTFVMHNVFESYRQQHGTETFDEGVTAARELRNSQLTS